MEEANITAIGRRAGMNYTSIIRHVEALKNMDILLESVYPGGIRMIRPNFNMLSVELKKGMDPKIRIEPHEPEDP